MTGSIRWAGVIVMAVALTGCGGGGSGAGHDGRSTAAERRAGAKKSTSEKIGLLLDTTHERWRRDRDLFVAQTERQGGQVLVAAAEGDQAAQNRQADEMLGKGINVLVLIPHDMQQAAGIVEKAKAKGVPVISYDRLVRDADVDLYITFDNPKVGELMADYALQNAPKGNYILIDGAHSDNNAAMYREGVMKVLGPAIKKGAIKIVHEGWADHWDRDEAAKIAAAGLDKAKNKVAAILAPNDVTAGGVVQVLQDRNLAGKVLVTGQDAELDAARRIVAGTQSMTVYKPVSALTRLASAWAMRLSSKERPDSASTTNNGRKDVPTMVVDPISVDKSNLDSVLIADGFHKREDVYKAS